MIDLSAGEWAALLTAFAALFGALGKIYVDLREVHKLVNSRLTELLELTRLASAAEGRLEGAALKDPAIPTMPLQPDPFGPP